MPTTSNTPIAASSPAPRTSLSPWSEQAAIRCVPIRPLVVAPQMKNAPASSQKSRTRTAPRNAPTALRNGFTSCRGGSGSTAP